MKIARNNLLTDENGFLQAVSDINVNYNVDVLYSPSFATVYNSAGLGPIFRVRYNFDEPTLINYVGLAGHNGGVKGGRMIILTDGVFRYDKTFTSDDFSSVVMATFPEILVTEIEYRFDKLTTDRIVFANVQAGNTIDFADPINNSEQSGYIRPWISLGSMDNTTLNRQSEPTVSLVRQMTKRVTLTIANLQGVQDSVGINQFTEFSRFITSETTWFMKEYDGTVVPIDVDSNYLCFNGEMKVSAGSNRQLNTLKISYNAYIGARA